MIFSENRKWSVVAMGCAFLFITMVGIIWVTMFSSSDFQCSTSSSCVEAMKVVSTPSPTKTNAFSMKTFRVPVACKQFRCSFVMSMRVNGDQVEFTNGEDVFILRSYQGQYGMQFGVFREGLFIPANAFLTPDVTQYIATIGVSKTGNLLIHELRHYHNYRPHLMSDVERIANSLTQLNSNVQQATF